LGKPRRSLKKYELTNLLFFLGLIIALGVMVSFVFRYYGNRNQAPEDESAQGVVSEAVSEGSDVGLFYLGTKLTETKHQYQSRLQRIKYTAFRLLSNRAHSSVELKRKLLSKGFELIPVEKVISSLTDDRFLNDEDFSSAYIEERSVKKKIGPQKIKAELFKRGVDRKVIEKLIVNIDPEQNFENLVNLATKKFKSIRNREQDFRKLRFKLYSYLSSRGFESDLIQKVLDLPYFKE